ncbi:hypothetical protein CUJ84_Chr004154 [Rhizobium leguminosarum]|uniref:Uncharacterized protein n=1 Tax=Rhizobium leguminosarum TaxID=384 RepID=A0A2K9Z8A1_RHILE|nr:hypothetical protein CUJ84_Chr004154 [Rhizobium leguminosarum]
MASENEIAVLAGGHVKRTGLFPNQRHADGGNAPLGGDETDRLRTIGRTGSLHRVEQGPERRREEIRERLLHRLAVAIGHDRLLLTIDDDRHVEQRAVDRHLAVIAHRPGHAVRRVDVDGGVVPSGVIVERRAELILEGLQRTDSRFARALVIEEIGIFGHAFERRQHHDGDDCDDDCEGKKHARDGDVTAYSQSFALRLSGGLHYDSLTVGLCQPRVQKRLSNRLLHASDELFLSRRLGTRPLTRLVIALREFGRELAIPLAALLHRA